MSSATSLSSARQFYSKLGLAKTVLPKKLQWKLFRVVLGSLQCCSVAFTTEGFFLQSSACCCSLALELVFTPEYCIGRQKGRNVVLSVTSSVVRIASCVLNAVGTVPYAESSYLGAASASSSSFLDLQWKTISYHVKREKKCLRASSCSLHGLRLGDLKMWSMPLRV